MPHKDKALYNAYMRVYMLRRYYERRNTIIQALGGKCTTCGSTSKLQLDHINSKTWLFDLAKRLHTAPKAVLEQELSKIQLLCQICHSRKSIFDAGNKPACHGSVTMYINYRCRCQPCREAQSRRLKAYRVKAGRFKGSNPIK